MRVRLRYFNTLHSVQQLGDLVGVSDSRPCVEPFELDLSPLFVLEISLISLLGELPVPC